MPKKTRAAAPSVPRDPIEDEPRPVARGGGSSGGRKESPRCVSCGCPKFCVFMGLNIISGMCVLHFTGPISQLVFYITQSVFYFYVIVHSIYHHVYVTRAGCLRKAGEEAAQDARGRWTSCLDDLIGHTNGVRKGRALARYVYTYICICIYMCIYIHIYTCIHFFI